MHEIRTVVADHHPVVLAGIRALMKGLGDIHVVGDATTAVEALALVSKHEPHVVVTDVSMGGMSGVDLTQALADQWPLVKIVILTVHEDRAYVQQVMKAGARGYLLKRSAAEDLIRAIRAVASGLIYLDPAITEKALKSASSAPPSRQDPSLSPRETEVLRLTARGFSNKQIAAHFAISVKTVETHKARAVEKLGLRARADIVRFGANCGWLDQLNGM